MYNIWSKDIVWTSIFTDTDNLMCEIKRNDAYGDFHKDKDKLDFSEYP